ncbi:hypothetical protein Hanom_Chr03g00217581 [Helianthus anomalus]
MHPIRMVQIRHFEFLCRSMYIEPTVNRFRKPKFFFIKAGVIPMKMTFRGKEDVVPETIQTPLSETWYQDLKDVLSIELPERALVAAGMSLYWPMEREDKPIYMAGDNRFGKSVPAVNTAVKKTNTAKAQSSKVKKARGDKQGTCHSSDSLCDYVVVFDSLEGLAPVVVRKAKAEPRYTADIPASNPEDPNDLESSPDPLVKTKKGKRKQVEIEAEAQPAKKM